MYQAYEDEIKNVIKDSFKLFANQLYDDVTGIINNIVANYESRLSSVSNSNLADNDNYNKVSMITRQDKEIVTLKTRISELERELIAMRSKNSLNVVNSEPVPPLIVEQPLVVEKKTRVRKTKEPKEPKEPKKTSGKKNPVEFSTDIDEKPIVTVTLTDVEVTVEDDKPDVVEEEKPIVVEEKKVDIERPTVIPNIDDLDILECDAVEYFLDPNTNYIYEITGSGGIGSCIGKKNGENNIFF